MYGTINTNFLCKIYLRYSTTKQRNTLGCILQDTIDSIVDILPKGLDPFHFPLSKSMYYYKRTSNINVGHVIFI